MRPPLQLGIANWKDARAAHIASMPAQSAERTLAGQEAVRQHASRVATIARLPPPVVPGAAALRRLERAQSVDTGLPVRPRPMMRLAHVGRTRSAEFNGEYTEPNYGGPEFLEGVPVLFDPSDLMVSRSPSPEPQNIQDAAWNAPMAAHAHETDAMVMWLVGDAAMPEMPMNDGL